MGWGGEEHAMAQTVSRPPAPLEAPVQSYAIPYGICCGQRSNVDNVLSTSVFPCQYYSNIAPYSFIHLQATLYTVFLPLLQFSPVSIIPPMLQNYSSIYHPRCIMFHSQHFTFPLSVSFTYCSILIHTSTTYTV